MPAVKGHRPDHPAVPERRPGRFARLFARSFELWQRALSMPVVWLAVLGLVGGAALTPWSQLLVPRVEVGAIADRDYVAPHDLLLPDEETTRARQERARESVLPVYDYDPDTGLDERLANFFADGRQLAQLAPARRKSETVQTRLDEIVVGSGLKASAAQASLLLEQNFSADLEDRLRGVAARAARRGMVLGKQALLENRLRGITLRNLQTGTETTALDLYSYLAFPTEVGELLDSDVRDWPNLTSAQRRSLVAFLQANLTPNLHFNKSETVARQAEAERATAPSFNQVRRGQIIARQGDQLDATAVRRITAYQSTGAPFWGRALPILGVLVLLALAAWLLWLTLGGERLGEVGRRRLYGEAMFLLVVSLLGAKLCFITAEALAGSFDQAPFDSNLSYLYGVPYAALGLCAALLLGRPTAVAIALVFSLLASRFAPADAGTVMLLSLAGSLAVIYSLDHYQVKQRLVMTRLGFAVGGVNSLLALLLWALAGGRPGGSAQLGFDILCGVAGGVLAATVASSALPIFEAVLGLATDIKLAELANTNLPLLRRLAYEAPGTFQHSLMVANLAKHACEAIGADAPLAYTAALYHDVGKMLRPDYFVENQRGDNPHNKLQPSMSALVLTSHVKDGVDLARQHHLPQPILDAIEQHHGTRLIKYFYSRAVEQQAKLGGEVREESFRYPGPRPQNRVMGVLMLADAIEAASRTLLEPSLLKIRTLIRTIVEDCLHDGQLDDTDLTLADLSRVQESFVRVLTNIFHQRVDYPGFDFNARPHGERERAGEKKGAKVVPLSGARAS